MNSRSVAIAAMSLCSGFLLLANAGQSGNVKQRKKPTRTLETVLPLTNRSHDATVRPSLLAALPAIKLHIKHEGWYRITGQELLASGLDPNVNPRTLQLFADGRPQRILIAGEEDGRLDESDVVEFYGIGTDAPTTDTRVYWLATGSGPGLRVPSASFMERPPLTSTSFLSTVERSDRSIYFSALRNGERENFFGPLIAGKGVEQAIVLHHVDPLAPAQGTMLEVTIQGTNTVPHRVSVELNGLNLTEIAFAGQVQGAARIAVSPSLLREGENLVRLTPAGGEADISLVDSIRITYWHTLAADGDKLRLSAPGRQQIDVEGFSSPHIRVFDVTTPERVFELQGRIEKRRDAFVVSVASPEAGERILLALTAGRSTSPVTAHLNQPSRLRRRQSAADLLIITPLEFFPAMEPVAALRRKQGMRVMMVDVEDIYDEFSFGQKTPQAIKDFLRYTRANWLRKPRFLLLAGDASLDPRSHLEHEYVELVPTKLLDTLYMETACDDWFADFNGDGLAEMAVGRLPFRTVSQAARMVAKILEDEGTGSKEVLLVSGENSSGYEFAEAASRLARLLPGSIEVRHIDRGKIDMPTARHQLLEGINHGPRIVNYMGHGSVDFWRENLLTADEAGSLVNANRFPVFVMMTCLNGYFQDPILDCLAEALMKAEHGGAVAVWTSSGQTEPAEQAVLNQEFFRQFFGAARQRGNPLTLGEAVLKAKAVVKDKDIRRTWILFGDPSMPILQYVNR